MNELTRRLPVALFALRITVFLVMLVWTVDKVLNPDHASAVYEHFYFLPGIGPGLLAAVALAELVIIILFLAGIARTWTYGAVLLFHAVSTLSSWQVYLDPYSGSNILFFAAWPMLAACFALFWLRDQDTMLTVGGRR